MLLLDNRAGSIDLYPALLAEPKAPPISLTQLEFGDACFLGNGPAGAGLMVGVEYKTVGDVLQCIRDGRFAGHQLPGMISQYDVCYLLIEGNVEDGARAAAVYFGKTKGMTDKARRGFAAFAGWVTSMEQSGLHIRQATGRDQGVRCLLSLYHWWQKPWDEHKSLQAVHLKPVVKAPVGGGVVLYRREPSKLEKALVELVDGLGWEKARALVETFPTLSALMAADEKTLKAVKGIGPKLAKQIREGVG